MNKTQPKYFILNACNFLLSFFILPSFCFAATPDHIGRMGVGGTYEVNNHLPTLSLKFQSSKTLAYGVMANYSSSETRGGWALGVKGYRTIFQEPSLNFYVAGAFILLSSKRNPQTQLLVSKTGYQLDASFGSEFHFQGIENLGFSVEFGVSLSKLYEKMTIDTLGHHLVTGAVHFYL